MIDRRDLDLGTFLRARREQLAPADVGLPDSGRRRTPGLRREEVATLAGVSVDYLIRLEQGRDTNPSPEVLNALATALRLSDDEKQHLGILAVHGRSPSLCPESTPLVTEVAPTVRELLRGLDPTPAVVVGAAADVLAWNPAWERIAGPMGILDDDRPNLARFVFLHPGAPAAYVDWAAMADQSVAQLRGAFARWGEDAWFTALVEELSTQPEFTRRWSTHTVASTRRGTGVFVHPEVGVLRLAYDVLLLPDDGDQRLVTWQPDDEATATALRSLSGTTRLRVVGS